MCLLENIYFGTHSFDDIHTKGYILKMKFTNRESEIIGIAKSGTFLNKEIAHLLDIKEETVRDHYYF